MFSCRLGFAGESTNQIAVRQAFGESGVEVVALLGTLQLHYIIFILFYLTCNLSYLYLNNFELFIAEYSDYIT